ncbi:ATP-dependent DNA ligase [Aestuariivirga litoralis]|uniref:DNA ligase (ATP) n=1 Tax=Aestuariivirga litoralis TaxID=2650924 RepID=A0A2W2BT08_9HYPH|nr:cisplatin damage response ATP-dependent DNA ligase [Aestuariivirga litoralis]PZF78817.1 ATP-dependent DNA ligase [Aestuariivirga litoralis]
MKAFSQLLDRLTYTPARNAKLMLMRNYFRATPDPDRGYALAALTDGVPIDFPLRRVLAEIGESRFDPELFRMSRDDVGDTAETVALIWPVTEAEGDAPRLSEIVAALSRAGRGGHAALLTQWLDRLDATGRWALLKFLSGAPRVGVSARLAKQAVANAFGRSVDDIEELWHGISPPYTELFDWLEQRAERPSLSATPIFRPLMLAHALEEADWQAMALDDFAAEWKWDGIRIQVAAKGGATRLFSRTGDDIGQAFPELVDHFKFDAVLDGELLVVRNGEVAPFGDLQQRLNRKTVTRAMVTKYPAHVRFYDALEIGGEDLRGLAFTARRERLEAWHRQYGPAYSDLSEVLSFASKEELKTRWEATREEGIEGLMLKRKSSPYLAGRPKGHWYKWKRAALTADCVLLYAQKGSGKRSSFYSDYTFGAWTEKEGKPFLVPVGKAYSGFTDEELAALDRFVRQNTIDRFGPVRSVTPKLVLEIAFDAIQQSSRHKSGIAMRFPRVSRIRWDKPAEEADTLETLKGLMGVAKS